MVGWPGRVHGRGSGAEAAAKTAGYLFQKGALDFAGGTVVHINAGIAGLVGALMLGKRIGYGTTAMPPHNLPLVMIGASLLWVGWFGFNVGSGLEANGFTSMVFANTILATAAAALAWSFAEWIHRGTPTMLGAASGAVAGLVAITPACGWVGPMGAIAIGAIAGLDLPVRGVVAEEEARLRRLARRVRRALRRRHRGRAADGGVLRPGPRRHWRLRLRRERRRSVLDGGAVQGAVDGVVVALVWSGVVAAVAFKLVDLVIGLRVPEEAEREGLDTVSHGERAYN